MLKPRVEVTSAVNCEEKVVGVRCLSLNDLRAACILGKCLE